MAFNGVLDARGLAVLKKTVFSIALHSGIEVLVPWYVVGHGFYSSYQVPTHTPLVLPDGEVLHSIRGCGGEAEGG